MTPEQILDCAARLTPEILSQRRRLHQYPETGFDLAGTLSYVTGELDRMGIRSSPCGRAGVTALVGGRRPGKVFLLRADMDALPIREEAEEPFASQNGAMHACGHDMHTAMLLGAARLLKEGEAELQGTVKLMFQPAEEILEGARDMISGGVLERPGVDAALMLHVMPGIPLPPGTVVVPAPGVSAPAADFFQIQVRGRGCHGSMPNTGVDPLSAAAHILIALQEIHARELSMGDRAALTIGSVQAGAAPNVIPDTVTMDGTLRAFREETRDFIKGRLAEIAGGVAGAFRAQAGVRFLSGCPTLINDPDLAACGERYARELLGQEKVLSAQNLAAGEGGRRESRPSGSEDFAYVSHAVPSLMLALAAGHPEQGFPHPLHHPMVRFDEQVLPLGSALYAYVAARWLEEHK